MQHHANHRPAWPLLAMRRARDRAPHQPGALQMHLRHGVAELVAVPLEQLLMKVLHREAAVRLAIQAQHPLDLLDRRTPARRLAQPTVRQPRRAFVAQPVPPTPKRALADPQHLRRLSLAQLTLLVPIEQCLEPHPTYPFVNSCPVHSRPLVGAVLKPDTSRATYSGQITS